LDQDGLIDIIMSSGLMFEKFDAMDKLKSYGLVDDKAHEEAELLLRATLIGKPFCIARHLIVYDRRASNR
jgi:hypothetical protein